MPRGGLVANTGKRGKPSLFQRWRNHAGNRRKSLGYDELALVSKRELASDHGPYMGYDTAPICPRAGEGDAYSLSRTASAHCRWVKTPAPHGTAVERVAAFIFESVPIEFSVSLHVADS